MRWITASLSLLLFATAASADEATVWIGTTTSPKGESRGIYRATLNVETGALSKPELAAEIASPGFVVLHPQLGRLYSVCHLPDGQGGGVAAFEVSEDEQQLRLLSSQPIGDGGAAHLAVDRTGRCLFTAQYGGGSVAAFPLDDNGKILPRSALVEHEGSGPDQSRQKGPHPHWVGVDPANRFLFVPDLGIDRVAIYRIDLDSGSLQRHGTGRAPAGGGPRHMKFHPNGKFAFVLNELQLSVTAFEYDAEAGTLSALQTISTLPEELREVRMLGLRDTRSPQRSIRLRRQSRPRLDRRFHGGFRQRGVDVRQREAVRGSWPRNFNLDPTGKWLLAAGGKSNTISVFHIDEETGGLIYTGKTVNCPTPICVTIGSVR